MVINVAGAVMERLADIEALLTPTKRGESAPPMDVDAARRLAHDTWKILKEQTDYERNNEQKKSD